MIVVPKNKSNLIITIILYYFGFSESNSFSYQPRLLKSQLVWANFRQLKLQLKKEESSTIKMLKLRLIKSKFKAKDVNWQDVEI